MLDTLSEDDRALLVVALAGHCVTAPSQRDKAACRTLMVRLLRARTVVLNPGTNSITEE